MKVIQKGLVCFLFFGSTYANAQARWDGGGLDGQWNTAANWVDDVIPGPGDDVLLDNSILPGNYSVTLPAGAVTITILHLTITPSPTGIIILLLPNTNTASPGLLVTGTGDAVVLDSGAIIKNSSGAISGSTPFSILSGSFRINNGGKYIHNNPRAHAGLVNVLSAAAGTENGTFEFDVPAEIGSFSVSASGRTYGNLVLSGLENGGSRSYTSGGGSILSINGNFSLISGAKYNFGLDTNIVVKGNLWIDATSEFLISTDASNNPTVLYLAGHINLDGQLTEFADTARPKIVFNGTSAQDVTIGANGEISGDIIVEIDNPAGVDLFSDFAVPYQFIFNSGFVNSSAANMLIFQDGTTHSGASSSSHVNGPVMKAGDEDFSYPVGDFGHYLPFTLTNLTSGGTQTVADTFIVEYFRSNPQDVYGSVVAPTLNHVSFAEYWVVEKISGTVSKYINLAVDSLSLATEADFLTVARYNGSIQWDDLGHGSFTGITGPPVATGNITGALSTNLFGIFTLGSTHPDSLVNPLPLKFMYVNAKRYRNSALISWKVSERPQSGTEFFVEHSQDGRNFALSGKISGDSGLNYHFAFAGIPGGISYYRIKATAQDGKMIISPIATIVNDKNDVHITKISSNPVTDKLIFQLFSSKRVNASLLVIEMNGKIVHRVDAKLPEGNTNLMVDVSSLPPGVYVISGQAAGQPLNSIRFVKQ